MDDLRNWCIKHDIENRTIQDFWKCFEDYKNNEYDEYMNIFSNQEKSIKIFFDKISYEVNYPEFTNEHICVYLDLFVNEKKIGWFKQLFDINGELIDFNFVIY